MKKRVLSLVLTLCMLLGLLPTAALAAPAVELAEVSGAPAETPPGEAELSAAGLSFTITPGSAGTCRSYLGANISDAIGGDSGHAWTRNDRGNYNVSVQGSGTSSATLTLKEKAKYKNASYILMPFTITTRVPARTRYTVTLIPTLYMDPNASKGYPHYFTELVTDENNVAMDWKYSTARSSRQIRDWTQWYLFRVGSDYSKFDQELNDQQLNFTNPDDSPKDVSVRLVMEVGVSAASSSQSDYFHQLECRLGLQYKSHSEQPVVAIVNGAGCTTEDIQGAYNAGSGATCTFVGVSRDGYDFYIKKPGTIDLNGNNLCTGFWILEQGDPSAVVTLRGGDATLDGKGIRQPIHHDGDGTVKVSNITITSDNKDPDTPTVHNYRGTMELDSDVTVEGFLFGNTKLKFNGGGPVVTERLGIRTPITLNAALAADRRYPLDLSRMKAQADGSYIISDTDPGGNNASHFTVLTPAGLIVVDDGDQIIARPYKITFDPAGGTVSPTTAAVNADGTAAAWPTPSRTGYTFTGWDHENSGFTTDTTVTAQWEAATVAVTYNANGGAVDPASGDQQIGGKYAALPTPTREGYDFAGWYTAQSGGTRVTGDTDVANANPHTLYAHWTRKQYTVTFDHGDGYKFSRSINAGSPVGTLPATHRAGYTLSPWRTSAGGGSLVTVSTVPTGDVTYYAHWVPVKVRLNYNANGGVLAGSATDQVTFGMAYGDLPGVGGVGGAPIRTGYTFTGWADAPTGGTAVTKDTVCNTVDPITIYAQWTANGPYTVSFDLNGAAGTAPGSAELHYDDTYPLPDDPARTGYTFAGWWTAPSGGTQVTAETKVTDQNAHTLYAHWTANQSTVTFNVNGGNDLTTENATKTVTYDAAYGALPTPDKLSHTFLGWFTAKTGGTEVKAGDIFRETADQTLYAHWRRDEVNVTLNVGGGDTLDDNIRIVNYGQTYGDAWGGSLPVPTHPNDGATTYTFTGWYSGTTLVTSTTVMNSEKDHTLTAHWATTHAHAVGGDDVSFTAVPVGVLGTSITTSGNYYLTDNVDVSTVTTVKSGVTLTLCLNGKTLTYTGGHQAFKVEGGGKLYICDCTGAGAVAATGDGVEVNSSFNSTDNTGARGVFTMEGGAITATNCGVRCYGGQFTMNDGSVTSTGEGTEKYGVALSAAANSSSIVTLNGGSVTARGDGSCGVSSYSNDNNKLTVNGATVSGEGHGVYVGKGAADILSGTVTGNTDGVVVSAGATATVSGTASVSGYTGAKAADGGTLNVTGGAISGTSGNGIETWGTTTVEGGTVTGVSWGSKYALNVAGGTATVTTGADGTSPTLSAQNGILVGAGTTLNVSGGNITGLSKNGIATNGTTNISGDAVITSGGDHGLWVAAGTTTIAEGSTAQITGPKGAGVGGGAALKVNGGSIAGTAGYGIRGEAESTITMTAGTVTSSGGNGITSDGATTIEGGAITGEVVGVNVEQGTFTMSGGTVTSAGYTISTKGATTISGGTVTNTGTTNAFPLYVGGGTATVSGTADVNGFGGAFVAAGGALNVDGGSVTSTGSVGINCAGTVNVTNGTVNGHQGGVLASSGATATISGGTVTGNLRGAQASKDGVLNVTGGTIIATKIPSSDKSYGIEVDGGTATISGGTVIGEVHGATATHSYADHSAKGALTITGGTFIGRGSAGVYMNDADFTLTGGNISGLAGVYMSSECPSFTLGGAPVIDGGDRHCDIGLAAGKVITLSTESPLSTDTPFSVAPGATPAEGAPIAITGTNAADESGHFTAFDAAQGVQNGADNVVQIYIPHKHPICGAVCTHTPAHEAVEFKPLVIGEGGAVENGNYYLPEDMNKTFDIATGRGVNLCLNGHILTTGQYANCLHYNAVLNLSDCSEGQTGGLKNTALTFAISVGGTFNQYSGILSTVQPQPVKLDPTTNSVWNFYGGKLAVNAATPTITPSGQVNLLADMGAVQFSLTDATKPVHISAKPATPYSVTSTVHPVTVADGLPASADVSQYFTRANDKLVLELAEGQATLRTFNITVSGGEVLSADASGKLTEAQLTAAKGANVGYTFDGFFTAAEGGDAVTAGTVFSTDATIYPRWTECTAHVKPGEGVTTVPSTCAVQGSESFICANCGLHTTNALPLAEHTFNETWTHDAAGHWHACAVCGATQEGTEAAHTWNNAGTTPGDAEDTDTYTCPVCAATKTETVPKYTYTLLTDAWSTPAGQLAQGTAREGASIALPTGVTRTGYTLAGWVPEGDATETILTGNYTMPGQDVTLRVKWTLTPGYQPEPGESVVLEDGATVTNNGDGTVTIQQPNGGSETTVTLPEGGGVTVEQDEDGNETVNVPAGSTVRTDDGPTVTVGEGGGAVDAGGGVDAGAGSTVTVDNGDGTSTTIEITGGDGHIDPAGGVTFPPADPDDPGATSGTVTVDKGDGNGPRDVTVSGDSGGVDPATGTVAENGPDDQVILPDGTVVTLPDPTDPDKGGVTDNGDGSTTVPGGSQVELKDGSTVTLGDTPGTVTENGDVTVPSGDTATVTDENGHQTTVTPGDGGTGTITSDGGVTLPAGGTVTVEDGKGGTTEITVPEGGGTVTKNEDGTLTPPAGSTVTNKDENGNTTGTSTVDGNTTVTPGTNPGDSVTLAPTDSITVPHVGTVTNNGDGTVTVTDLHGNETTVTLPEGTTNIEVDSKTGEVTLPAGSTVQTGETGPEVTVPGGGAVAPGGHVTGNPLKVGETTVTVTDPAEGKLTADKDGNVTVPGGSTVTYDKDSDGAPETTVTTPAGGDATVKPDGTVDLPKGGTVTRGDTTITVPEGGGSVGEDSEGNTTVPAGSEVKTGEGPTVGLPNGGTVDNSGNVTGSPVTVGGTTVTVTDPANGEVTTTPSGETTIPGGATAEVEKGGTTTTVTVPAGDTPATVDPATGETTVPGGTTVQTGDAGTQITVGPGNGGTVNDKGEVTVPAGGTATVDKDGDGTPDATVTPGDKGDATVKPDGGVTLPAGGSVTVPSGEEGKTTTVTLPDDKGGTVTTDEDGNLVVPGGSQVTKPDGSTETVPTQGGTVAPGGTVTPGEIPVIPGNGKLEPGETVTTGDGSAIKRDGDAVTITDSEGTTTTVTLPAGTGDVAVDEQTGAVTLPEGSKVQTAPDGPEITLPQGGTVVPGGTVTGDPVQVGDTTVTATVGTIITDKDGNTTIPAGGAVQTGTGPEIALPQGGTANARGEVTLDPDKTVVVGGGQEITVGPGGTVDPDGTVKSGEVTVGNTTVTVPMGGGTANVDVSGEITVPAGATVQTGDGPEIGLPEGGTVDESGNVTGSPVTVGDTTVTVTAPENGAVTTDPSGETTIPAGTTAEVEKGGTATTVTVPAGDTPATVDPATGETTVPGGTKVQTGDGPEITLPDGGTVKPDGTVTVPENGKVTVTDGTVTTTITPPGGGEVMPSEDGGVHVPEGTEIRTGDGPVITFPEIDDGLEGGGTVLPGGRVEGSPVKVDDTTVTVTGGDPTGGAVTTDPTGSVTLPGGTTAEVDDGQGHRTEVTVPGGETGTVAPGGGMDLPGGATITILPGGVRITLPAEGGEVRTDPDGNLVVPAGSTVTKPDGGTQTVPEGGVVKPDGTVESGGAPGPDVPTPNDNKLQDGETVTVGDAEIARDGDAVTVTKGDTTTTVTLPAGTGDVAVDEQTGELTLPDGSKVKTDDGPEVELPGGGTVTPGGEVSGSSVQVGGVTVTVTDPADGEVTTAPGGETTVPAGSTATVDDGQGHETEIAVPGDGDGATVTPGGETTVPGGTKVQTGSGPEITVGGQGGTVDPATGTVTPAPGGSVTIPDGDGGTTTITPPSGGAVTPNPDGSVEAPAGSEVTHTDKDGNTTTDRVPDQGGTVRPDGTVESGGDVPTPPTPETYTVTFDAMGGEPVPPAQTVAGGGKLTKPADPAKTGCVFGGWFKDETWENIWDFDRDVVTADRTLYAKWIETFGVSGTVTEGGNPADGVTVKLMRGSEQFGEPVVTQDGGRYSFRGLTPGYYNLVATKGDKTVTSLVIVEGADVEDKLLALPGDNVNSVLEVVSGGAVTTPDVVVGELDTEAEKVAREEKDKDDAVSSVTVTMTVQSKEESDETIQTSVAEIREEIRKETDAAVTVEYMEITVTKEVVTAQDTAPEPEPISETQTVLEIVIPFDFTGKDRDSVKVYRCHGGRVDVLTTEGNDDGEKIALGADYIIVYANKFSTYAVGYENLYKVTVETDGHGTATATPDAAVEGATITLAATPDSGYRLKEWVVDGEAIRGDRFTMPAKDVIVKAIFEERSNSVGRPVRTEDKTETPKPCPQDETCPIHAFTDADATAWYHDGVHFCLEKGLMVGTSDATFEPETPTSRAMIATVLWRLQGSKVVNFALQYDDVPEGTWYTEAVRWATSEGIVQGYDNGSFGPDDPITREQLAVMLYRYEQKYGKGGFTGNWMFLLDFTDRADVSEWAYEALCWMTMRQVVTGKGDKVLDPQGQATRAETATMLQRFLTLK